MSDKTSLREQIAAKIETFRSALGVADECGDAKLSFAIGVLRDLLAVECERGQCAALARSEAQGMRWRSMDSDPPTRTGRYVVKHRGQTGGDAYYTANEGDTHYPVGWAQVPPFKPTHWLDESAPPPPADRAHGEVGESDPFKRIPGLHGIADAADYLARNPGDEYATRRLRERLDAFAEMHGLAARAPSAQGEAVSKDSPFYLEPLPERDPSKPNAEQGLYRKFDVRRTDGSDQPGGKHHGCEYFVLDVSHDRAAPYALAAYAEAIKATHPDLARDLIDRYDLALYTSAPAAGDGFARSDVHDLVDWIFTRFGAPVDAGELPQHIIAAVRRLEAALAHQEPAR